MSIDAVVDAAEFLLSELSERDAVAHAEVAGVTADCSDVVVTDEGIRTTTSFTTTGIWWRLFADGSADHRYSSSLEEDHLLEMVDRSVRSAMLLGQQEPARFDPETAHRATHPGWGDGSLADQPVEEAAETIRDALDAALDGQAVDRARVEYRTRAEETALLTTSGTTLRTTVERASMNGTVAPAAGGKVQSHHGATTGTRFLERVPEQLESLAQRAARVADSEPTASPKGQRQVVLAPQAAAAVVAAFSTYLELDTAYLGSSPFDVGDQFGPEGLTIEDTARPGSWAARAYDTEGRPAHPTTLVDDGIVNGLMADTAGAVAEQRHPAGNMIPSIGWEEPPRIHARHLDVSAGDAAEARLREDAAVAIERVGVPEFVNEATKTKRASGMPPSTLYAKDISAQTPSDFDDEATNQRIRFPIREGYLLEDGDRAGRLTESFVVLGTDDIRATQAMSVNRDTNTGTHEKHTSTLPWAATAPAMVVPARFAES